MKRTKQIARMTDHLIGKRIKIFTGLKTHWAIALVKGFTGAYLELEDIQIWNGRLIKEDMLHANSITKIEIIK